MSETPILNRRDAHLRQDRLLPYGLRLLERFEELFIGGNEVTTVVAVDILKGICGGLDYFVRTQGKCAALMSEQSDGRLSAHPSSQLHPHSGQAPDWSSGRSYPQL